MRPAVAGSRMCGKMRNSKFGRVRGIPHVREILDWPSVVTAVAGLWRVEGIKPRQEPRPGRGRYGALTRGVRKTILNFELGM